MSAWRKEASERLPEFQKLISSRDVDNPMMLWIELQFKFHKLCEQYPLPLDLIRRIWEYAKWCMEKGHPDVATAAALGFCEHLLDGTESRKVLPALMTRTEYVDLQGLLLYHNSEAKFEEVLNTFEPDR